MTIYGKNSYPNVTLIGILLVVDTLSISGLEASFVHWPVQNANAYIRLVVSQKLTVNLSEVNIISAS